MKALWLAIITSVTIVGSTKVMHRENNMEYNNQIREDRMLIVLSAPSMHNEYYREDFEAIVAFQKRYAQEVLGNDNIVILVDEDTRPYYADTLPSDILLEATVEDILIRDFSTVLPETMVQFTYDPSYFESPEDAEAIQMSFVDFSTEHDLQYAWKDYVLDGGNVVDNGNDKLITTTRFLEENDLTAAEAKAMLRETTGVKEVAIIEYDDEVMVHADGMVMWGDERTLFLNTYDEPFRSTVMQELETAFTGITIVEVPVQFEDSQWRDFNSACGIHLNAVVTYNHIYMPIFNQPDIDQQVQDIIRSHTNKSLHTITAEHVCHMGGSVRCLSWQITGENAAKLILDARD